jgi:hypothetical protein
LGEQKEKEGVEEGEKKEKEKESVGGVLGRGRPEEFGVVVWGLGFCEAGVGLPPSVVIRRVGLSVPCHPVSKC